MGDGITGMNWNGKVFVDVQSGKEVGKASHLPVRTDTPNKHRKQWEWEREWVK